MSKRFAGKRVLLTGGASGIGRATAELFAAEGADIVIGDIDETGGSAVADGLGGRFIRFDAMSVEAPQALVSQAAEALGGLDILLNIAGVMTWGRFEATPLSAWQRTLDINLTAVFLTIQAAIPHLRASKGNVVNVASAGGLMPVYGTVAYGVSKAAIVALTKSAALELGRDRVRVNAVAPGGVATPMHAKTMSAADFDMSILEEAAARNRPKLAGMEACQPEDIAGAIAYLASDEARFVTGSVSVIDGGQLCG
ncbi:MAG TPA: SDR family NAD(P)-dependent oxidoreductase [Sphingomonas sp.]|nr:SDR family NAD(P)-dependent oxidoreductase [Sphingomonas sp.]